MITFLVWVGTGVIFLPILLTVARAVRMSSLFRQSET